MARLNAQARQAIREAGFTQAQWAAMWGYSGEWGGDQCGCLDDRCANGFHHAGVGDCGCLETMIADAVAWRQAVEHPNRVELAAPFGLFRWVTTVTPGVLATVSATGGSPGPEESRVRIEPREGWTAEVTQQDGRVEVRIVKAAAPAAGEQETP